jgi:hypothetical protein
MENKYYKPTISEFSIGFRYESCIPYRRTGDEKWTENWVKHEYSLLDFEWTIHTILTQLQFDDAIRVKYLDEIDIIELGWKLTGRFYHLERIEFELDTSSLNAYGITNGDKYFYITKINDLYMIYTTEKDEVLFKGKISNYNELLKIMQMLNINPSENVKG